ncbi:MAG: ABC transporter substrate-binding protein, partial [Acidimicrobiia bacterium]
AGRPAGPAPAPQSPAGPAPPSGSAVPAPSGEDRTGVSDTEIVIGLHAPITGAAPVPQDSLEKAKGLYWRFVAEHGGIFGRNVRVIIKDDQFNPAHAVQVCREMVEREKVFLLMGIGTDQTIACARYASQVGVPYFATGGSQAGFADLPTYFNVSMTFPQQAPMVARLVQRASLTKVGVLTINTPNYNDTHSALEAAARSAGLQVVRSSRINKSASQSETLAEANAMRTAGAEAVMMMVAPLVFLNLAHAAQGQAYNPMWTGPGLSNGLNLVAEFGCPSIGKATFLSPFPQLDVIDRFDADYKPMYRRVNGEEADDLGLALWGLDKTLHRFFEATGRDLSRQRFLAILRSGREFASNILPPVHYSPGNPFGAAQAHVLEADCSSRAYRTMHTFVASL